jgi:hypothetical protein
VFLPNAVAQVQLPNRPCSSFHFSAFQLAVSWNFLNRISELSLSFWKSKSKIMVRSFARVGHQVMVGFDVDPHYSYSVRFLPLIILDFLALFKKDFGICKKYESFIDLAMLLSSIHVQNSV